ncbi:site-specific integrase [Acinetobacter johnsonii]|uniref:site-specific integrase n=1 Tax=Acinetobacter johnsonii TaxID=40214 RepID=UPI00244BD259|nr:site-specific integrase [Acinetobacter johnsonii]MDH1278248.1 site-specific integrase [Acinetobacter johnsonii]MDH1712756.1 site-specific integrase [Acinetobacter johnsonii]MDQ8975234.1 tyrosine-type recombinase/integrase [Acinetobacter johnsonii]
MADSKSTKSMPTGVRIRNGSIQINFKRNKQAYIITLPHPPTAEGITAAAKIREQLIIKAEWNILTDKDIAEAKGNPIDDKSIIVGSGVLFQEAAQKYLKQCESNMDTKKGYKNILEKHWMPHLALVPLHEITSDDIKEIIIEADFQTAKTLNNCLIPLRGVFSTALENKYISENPVQFIKNKKVQVDVPDPFSRAEMNVLLSWLDKNLEDKDHFYYWYYEMAFWSGCRPSELIALRWSDIDWFNGTMRINKSRVRGHEKNVTKTHTVREVYLNERSTHALKAIKDLKLSSDYIMICPETNAPFFNEKPPRLRITEAMKSCMIRHRPAYNARHTYATMMLMDGLNPVFVSNQMGHSLQMMMKRYVKWMHGDKNKIEMGKLKTD